MSGNRDYEREMEGHGRRGLEKMFDMHEVCRKHIAKLEAENARLKLIEQEHSLCHEAIEGFRAQLAVMDQMATDKDALSVENARLRLQSYRDTHYINHWAERCVQLQTDIVNLRAENLEVQHLAHEENLRLNAQLAILDDMATDKNILVIENARLVAENARIREELEASKLDWIDDPDSNVPDEDAYYWVKQTDESRPMVIAGNNVYPARVMWAGPIGPPKPKGGGDPAG